MPTANCSDSLTRLFEKNIKSDWHVLIRYNTNYLYVVNRVPVTGTRSTRFAYRQSLWLADMWHAYLAAG